MHMFISVYIYAHTYALHVCGRYPVLPLRGSKNLHLPSIQLVPMCTDTSVAMRFAPMCYGSMPFGCVEIAMLAKPWTRKAHRDICSVHWEITYLYYDSLADPIYHTSYWSLRLVCSWTFCCRPLGPQQIRDKVFIESGLWVHPRFRGV